jgi:hypothetical protein
MEYMLIHQNVFFRNHRHVLGNCDHSKINLPFKQKLCIIYFSGIFKRVPSLAALPLRLPLAPGPAIGLPHPKYHPVRSAAFAFQFGNELVYKFRRFILSSSSLTVLDPEQDPYSKRGEENGPSPPAAASAAAAAVR